MSPVSLSHPFSDHSDPFRLSACHRTIHGSPQDQVVANASNMLGSMASARAPAVIL